MRAQKKERVDTLIASDWHLGWRRCEAKTILVMLSHFKCERLILNGDHLPVTCITVGKTGIRA
jgi:hypothetical protein